MKNALIVMALLGILLFGCIGGTPAATQQKAGDTTGTTTTDEIITKTTDGTTSVLDTLTGKTFEEMVKLGIPIECDVTYKVQAQEIENAQIKMYFKGNKFKVITKMTANGINAGTTIIANGDGFAYSQFEDKTLWNAMTNGKLTCDWLKVEVDTTASDSGVGEYTDDSKVDMNCKPGLFGDDIFFVSGKACTMAEIQNAMMG
ncbi:MAG: hypothetical protein WCT31_05540 [Candidatus Micrarchaeia archaeon]